MGSLDGNHTGESQASGDSPSLRIMRFSGEAFKDGVERHRIQGVNVQIYSASKDRC